MDPEEFWLVQCLPHLRAPDSSTNQSFSKCTMNELMNDEQNTDGHTPQVAFCGSLWALHLRQKRPQLDDEFLDAPERSAWQARPDNRVSRQEWRCGVLVSRHIPLVCYLGHSLPRAALPWSPDFHRAPFTKMAAPGRGWESTEPLKGNVTGVNSSSAQRKSQEA